MLFSLQILIEKIRNSESEPYITFIDYSKAFDSVKHHRLFHHMVQMGFPRHLVALIAGLYEHQQATIRFGSPGSLIISRLQFERPSILLLNMLDIPLLMKKHWGAHSGSGPVFRKTKKEKG